MLKKKLGKTGGLFSLRAYKKGKLEKEIIESKKIKNAAQLAFLYAYYYSEKGKPVYKPEVLSGMDYSDVKQAEAISAFYSHKIHFFNQFSKPIGWVDISKLMYVDNENLALPEERCPEWVPDWAKLPGHLSFLSNAGLQTNESPISQLRLNLFKYVSCPPELINDVADDTYFFHNTFRWMAERFPTRFSTDSNLYDTYHKLAKLYFEKNNILPEYFLILKGHSNAFFQVQFQKIIPSKTYCYIDSIASVEVDSWIKAIEVFPRDIIDLTRNYSDQFKTALNKVNIHVIYLAKSLHADMEKVEWEDKYYKKWKEKEGASYQIYQLDKPVPFDYIATCNGYSHSLGAFHQGEAAILEQNDLNQIFLYLNNRNPFDLLLEYKNDLFKRDVDALLSLLRLRLSNLNETEDVGGYPLDINLTKEEHQRLNQEISKINTLLNKANPEQLDSIVQNIDTLQNLLANADKQDLDRISAEIDLIRQLLAKFPDRADLEALIAHLEEIKSDLDRRQKKVTPNALVGYIGERLIYWWLKNSFPEPNIVDYVAQHEWAYDIDFTIGAKNYKIDVKTTIKSVREEGDTIPFFIKQSQYSYIKQNPEENYFIARLSLKDLGLAGEYNRLKNRNMTYDELIEEIDEVIKIYLTDTNFLQCFRANRMVFRMAMPSMDNDFFEAS